MPYVQIPIEIITRHKRQQLPFVFICVDDDFKMRLEQMALLLTPLIATKTEFSDELTFMSGIAPMDANSPDLECGGMQVKCCQKKTLRI
jgi:[histone H3]-lysine27 N-methyltransferase